MQEVPTTVRYQARLDSEAASAMKVSVVVVGLSGDEIATLVLPATASIFTVKEKLVPVCAIPLEMQLLFCLHEPEVTAEKPSALLDNRRLGEFGRTLCLQLVRLTERSDVLQNTCSWHVVARRETV